MNFKVLVLDDDEGWLARHERRLRQAGIDFVSTQEAREAIKVAKTDPSVKFALIDEILYVPPVPIPEEERELQRWQGNGVVREITAQRSDLQIIIVSAAPKSKSGDDVRIFRQETAKLRRQRGVIDVVHKVDIEEDADTTYSWLIDLLKQPQSAASATVVMLKVLIGLGFTREEHAAMAEQMKIRKQAYLPIAPLLKKAGGSEISHRILENFWERAREKAVLLEMPGSKRLERLPEIKPDSSAFRILAFLAQQSEQQAEIRICEKDYRVSSRRTKRMTERSPECDPRVVRDFAFDYGENGRRHQRSGVQIEKHQEQPSPLKVAIHRLKHQLNQVNVGPANQLFLHEQNGYRPQFELGIVLYAVKT